MDQVEKVQDRPKKRSAEDGTSASASVTVWEQCAKEVASLVREAALTGDQSEALFNKALAAYVDLLKVSKVCKTIREAILAKGGGAAAAAESRAGQLTALPAPAPVSGAIANQGAGGGGLGTFSGVNTAAKTVLPSGLASCKAPLPLPLPPPPPPITTSVWPVSFLNDCHDYCYFSDRRRRLRFGDDWYDSGEVYDDEEEEDEEEEEEEDWLDYDEDEEEEEDWLDYDEDDEGGEDVEVDDDEVIDYSKPATSGSGNGSRHKRARH